jgi:hypothetical protein
MITARQARKLSQKARIKFLCSHVLLVSKMANKEIDIVQWVLKYTGEMLDMNQKAAILSIVAKALTNAGQCEKGLNLFRVALNSAKLAGWDTVLETIANGASTIAATDDGETLWQVYESIVEVEDW